jgi:lysophospholipase L1-like esterase
VRRFFLLAAAGGLFVPIPAKSRAGADIPPRFEWKDGDRVVLIGDDLIEREQKSGYVETFLTIKNPDKTITFRNLGWSGDTPAGIARARFGPPAEGFQHLKEHVLALRPTVLIVGYGMTSSFDFEPGLPRFKNSMNQLLDDLAETGARLVLLSPIAHEDLGRPLPDPVLHNRSLRLYRDAIREIAQQRGAWFIDLLGTMLASTATGDRTQANTEDGIHLNERGYRLAGLTISRVLGADPVGQPAIAEQTEQLRRAIIEKNRLYFYRWRPQNETYLFGFRKHEQGNNAREIPLFDPLVAEKEQEIARLRVPVRHVREPIPESEESKR